MTRTAPSKRQGPTSLAPKTRRREGVGRLVSQVLADRGGDPGGIAGVRVMTPDGRRLFATQAVVSASGAVKVYLAESRRDDADEVGVLPADRLTLLAAWPQGRGEGRTLDSPSIATFEEAS